MRTKTKVEIGLWLKFVTSRARIGTDAPTAFREILVSLSSHHLYAHAHSPHTKCQGQETLLLFHSNTSSGASRYTIAPL